VAKFYLAGPPAIRSLRSACLSHCFGCSRNKKWLGAASLLYAFYVGLSVSMTVHWFSDFASGIVFGFVVGTTVGRSFAAMDFPGRGNGVQNDPVSE
jgi:hypothetical protein